MSDNIQLFLSWAHDDAKLKESFLKLLEPRLGNARNHVFTWWRTRSSSLARNGKMRS